MKLRTLLLAAALATPLPAAARPPIHLQEGTALSLVMDDDLSSSTSQVGDRFSVSLAAPIDLGGGVVIPAGYRGVGEVTAVEHKGYIGKAGNLGLKIDYLDVGGVHVPVRGARGAAGNGEVGATVGLVILFGPLGLLMHGHDAKVHRGQSFTAYVDRDEDLPAPLPPPPPGPS